MDHLSDMEERVTSAVQHCHSSGETGGGEGRGNGDILELGTSGGEGGAEREAEDRHMMDMGLVSMNGRDGGAEAIIRK